MLRLRPSGNSGPDSPGWHIGVYEPGRGDDLSQFTTPFSGPNPRDVFPWFDDEGRFVNSPGPQREFYFSPEVGRTIVWEDDTTKRRANTERIEAFGRGTFDVLDFRAAPLTLGGVKVIGFRWLKFSACLTWPAAR